MFIIQCVTPHKNSRLNINTTKLQKALDRFIVSVQDTLHWVR